MIGAKGFRAREAAANYKRRVHRLVPDEIRAARFANMHGHVAETNEPAEPVEPVKVETEVTADTQVGEAGAADVVTSEGEAEGGEENGSDAEGSSEGSAEADADKANGSKPSRASKPKSKKK
jgi:hypothetical protein